MAAWQRMLMVKGAVLSLLLDAYQCRGKLPVERRGARRMRMAMMTSVAPRTISETQPASMKEIPTQIEKACVDAIIAIITPSPISA